MLPTISKSRPDIGDHLMAWMHANEKKDKEKALRREIARLKSTRDKLKQRCDNLKQDFTSNDGSRRKRPLSTYSKEVGLRVDKVARRSEQDSLELAQKLVKKHQEWQTMSCYELCLGLNVAQLTKDTVSYEIRPNVNGRLYGPYSVNLSKDNKKLGDCILPGPDACLEPPKMYKLGLEAKKFYYRLTGSNGPVIPVKQLLLNNDDNFFFLSSLRQHLTAYIGRAVQVAEVQEAFGDHEVHDVSHNRDLTQVQFTLAIDDESSQSDNLKLQMAMTYASTAQRPEQGSLQLTLRGSGAQNLDDDALEALEEQCTALYSHPLKEAVKVAFAE